MVNQPKERNREMRKKEIYIYNILNKIRGPYLMESGLVELTSKGLMQCNNDTLKNLLFLISLEMLMLV